MKISFASLFICILIAGQWACSSGPSEQAADTSANDSVSTDTAQWETMQTQNEPTARHENAFTEANGKFYLIGGRGSRPVDIYDPQSNTWSEGHAPPLEMHHFQAVSYQGKIYVMGAFTGGFPDEKPIPNIYIYDPEADSWEKGPEIPQNRRRGAAGVAIYNDKFYLVDGIVNGHTDGYQNWLDEYDPATNTWKTLPDAPHKRDHVQAAIAGDKIFVAGGRTSSAATNQTLELTIPEVDVYDFNTGAWTTLDNDIPTQRAGTASVVIGDEVIVLGGESTAHEEAHNEVEALNINTLEWRTLPPLNKGRHGTGAAVYNGNIYMAAGSGNRGGGPELTSMEMYEP